MATFTVKFECDNAAFDEGDGMTTEIARILRAIATRVEEHAAGIEQWETIRDLNGNDVGRFGCINPYR